MKSGRCDMSILNAKKSITCALLLATLALTQSAYGGAECASLGGGCDEGGDWDPMAKLDEIGTGIYDQAQASANWPAESRKQRWNMSSGSEDSQGEDGAASTIKEDVRADLSAEQSTGRWHEIIIEIDEISNENVLLDVSESAKEHISGSIAIPYQEFLQGDSLKSVPELAEILGNAGISSDDPLVIYGECLPCGGGPSASAYVYWMLKSLGHEDVRILNGYVQDWKDKGLPVSSNATTRPVAEYVPQFTDQYIGSYNYVKSGQAQVVDARTVLEYESGTIPSAISIPYESVLDGDKLRNVNELDERFFILDKEQQVVAFTNTGFKGSVLWLALEIMGYDAKLYSYQNWMANQLIEQRYSDAQE